MTPRWGLIALVLLAFALAFTLAAQLAGCGAAPAPAPDAAPPSCTELGCDVAFCTSDGVCSCHGEVCRGE